MRAEGSVARFGRWWLAGGEPRLSALDLGLILGFVALLLAGAWFAEAFFTERNMSNLMRQVVANGLISLGMLLVILTGGIDLSVGSVVALGGVLFAGIADQLGIGAALAIAIACGAAAGLVNGVIIARFKLQSFIVTLATMGIVRGCVYLYTEIPLSPSHPGFRDLGATLVGRPAAPLWRSAATRRRFASQASTSSAPWWSLTCSRARYPHSRARSSSRAWALRSRAWASLTNSTRSRLA
jgi:ABC-type xylose transport system permease subunit